MEAIKFEEKPSESEYFLSFKIFFLQIHIIQSESNHLTPRCTCAVRGKKNWRYPPSTTDQVSESVVLPGPCSPKEWQLMVCQAIKRLAYAMLQLCFVRLAACSTGIIFILLQFYSKLVALNKEKKKFEISDYKGPPR